MASLEVRTDKKSVAEKYSKWNKAAGCVPWLPETICKP